jgi:hypothetical protein
MHWPRLAPRRQSRAQPCHQPRLQLSPRSLEPRHHRGRNRGTGQQIPRRCNARPPGLPHNPQRPRAGEDGHAPARSTTASCRHAMSRVAPVTASSAARAPIPCSSRSSSRGPSAGSVTFCDATAPTPARAWAQRAATAGEEEDIASPNCPVAGQRASKVKVIAPLSSSSWQKYLAGVRGRKAPDPRPDPGSPPWHRSPPAIPCGQGPSPPPQSIPDAPL